MKSVAKTKTKVGTRPKKRQPSTKNLVVRLARHVDLIQQYLEAIRADTNWLKGQIEKPIALSQTSAASLLRGMADQLRSIPQCHLGSGFASAVLNRLDRLEITQKKILEELSVELHKEVAANGPQIDALNAALGLPPQQNEQRWQPPQYRDS